MKRLFVNADDFGLTDGIGRGIAEAMAVGIVGGTTAMVCPSGAVERLARLVRQEPILSGRVGLHLQLTGGVPCLPARDVPSLVGPDGAFPRKKTAVGKVDPDEVRREWRAQLARLRSLGIEPSHLDSHHHIHERPDVFPVFVELARELGLPARALSQDSRRALSRAGVPHTDACVTRWFGENLTANGFLSLVTAAFEAIGDAGTVEVMTHPGRFDALLAGISTYTHGRETELGVLTSPDLVRQLAGREILIVDANGLTDLAA